MKIGWFQYLRILIRGKEALKEAIAQGQILKNVHAKSTWKSTEFLTSALAAAGAILAQAQGVIPAPYGVIVASVSAAFYAVSRGLAKSGDPLGGVKPALATTEFWANLLVQAGNVMATISGAVTPEIAATLMVISNCAYGISRGLAKGGTQPVE